MTERKNCNLFHMDCFLGLFLYFFFNRLIHHIRPFQNRNGQMRQINLDKFLICSVLQDFLKFLSTMLSTLFVNRENALNRYEISEGKTPVGFLYSTVFDLIIFSFVRVSFVEFLLLYAFFAEVMCIFCRSLLQILQKLGDFSGSYPQNL